MSSPKLHPLILVLAATLVIPVFGQDSRAAVNQSNAPKAAFFLIGGNAKTTLADFVQLAGGDKANIAIITHAAEEPAKMGDELQNAFNELGVKNTTVILPGTKTGLPKDTTAVYICGGAQTRLKRLLEEPMLSQLLTFDGLIGGSSAGAMIAAPRMIAGGMDEHVVKAQSLNIIDGLNFVPNVVIDTHVGERSRDTRLMAALVLIETADLGIGLDEDTAVYIHDGKAKVYGEGNVRLFKRGEGFRSNVEARGKNTLSSVHNVVISVLSSGDDFDLPVREVLTPGK
ncbi:MAG: cyanophycinase [Cyanobacteria bacterium SZAS LIN-5]|nr:cyanophycinase [Cyanobacteria bacterium SZAS LIN-5]RTL43217.1 MAG: cyanophycinase [Candidatus Melainabacteria bacterium]